MNASTYFVKEKPKNALTDEGIAVISEVFQRWETREKLSRVVTLEEVRDADYNLGPSLFVDINDKVHQRPVQAVTADLLIASQRREAADQKLDLVIESFRNEKSLRGDRKTVSLEDVADVRGGSAFPDRYQGERHGAFPFYKVSDMNLRGNETYLSKANNWVSEDVVRALKARPFEKGTVVFPKVGAALLTNKKRLLSCPALVDNNVMGVSLRKDAACTPEYLLYWFETVDLQDFSNPGPLPSINGGRIKQAELPLPTLEEQLTIVQMLQAVQKAREARWSESSLLDELFRAMLEELVAKKV